MDLLGRDRSLPFPACAVMRCIIWSFVCLLFCSVAFVSAGMYRVDVARVIRWIALNDVTLRAVGERRLRYPGKNVPFPAPCIDVCVHYHSVPI